MNIAVLIGISKYKLETALPACYFDVENMRRLLVATKKYDEILCISDNTNASQVKDALRAFFTKHQSTPQISEALIYFSGHGVYQNDALLCCADYDSGRPASTSISNSELDDLLRSVAPNVAVKIIDACQSGSPYIKDASAGFEKALRGSTLNSFICMASSRQDQSSYASETESDFTSKWIDAALVKQDGQILYRDIQAALADAFVLNPDQTPFFISQGTGLEIFSSVTDEMRALLAHREKSATPERASATILQLVIAEVAKRDQQYVPHGEAMSSVEKSKNLLISQPIADTLVSNFYEKTTVTDLKLLAIPKARAVAEFAQEQAWTKKFFAKISTENYRVRVPKDFPVAGSFSNKYLRAAIGLGDDSEYVYENRTRAVSLEATEALPFEMAELSFNSEHSSLPAFKVYIGIVHSLVDVMVLSSTVRLMQKSWSEKAPELTEVQWRYQSYTWSSVVSDPTLLWKEALQRGELDIRNYLESLVPNKEKTDAADEVVSS